MYTGTDHGEGIADGFPRAAVYRNLLHRGERCVSESSARYGAFPYTERHLQCLWADERWRPVLHSLRGEPVSVLSPGRWNLEAGPDFLDAVLLAGPEKRRLVGDVEIHIRPDDWVSHGHHNDPRYGRVAAHVTYFPGAGPETPLPPGCIQIALRDALRADPEFSFENIDVTAYPYDVPSLELPPCAEALAEWGPDGAAAVLDAAGEERLRLKALRMRRAIEDAGREQVFYAETLAALGYKHNRRPFRVLANRVPAAMLRRFDGDLNSAYAVLAGVSDLLPAKHAPGWDGASKSAFRAAWDAWWRVQSEWDHLRMNRADWHTANVRPQNHPRRRLAAAVGLFAATPDLFERLTSLDAANPEVWFADARALLTDTPVPEFWQSHLGYGASRTVRELSVIGTSRAAAIVSNVFVPFLAATGQPVAHLLPCLPWEGGNAITRQAAALLFGRDHNPRLYRHGLREQGLLQVFHDFCIRRGATCRDCPFPGAIRASGKSA